MADLFAGLITICGGDGAAGGFCAATREDLRSIVEVSLGDGRRLDVGSGISAAPSIYNTEKSNFAHHHFCCPMNETTNYDG